MGKKAKADGAARNKPDAAAQRALLVTLEERFSANPARHPRVKWSEVRALLDAAPQALVSLAAMEASGGEPDVVSDGSKELVFFDCSAESPKGRRSICYDRAALDARKENKPATSAEALAAEMGVALMSEREYRLLQTFGAFDLKTSSWIETPQAIRRLGGALFCDRRYDTVFTYHNGAESYYAARGFRGVLRVNRGERR